MEDAPLSVSMAIGAGWLLLAGRREGGCRYGSITAIEGALTKKILELRESGFQVSSNRVRLEAAKLDRDFKSKSKKAQQMVT